MNVSILYQLSSVLLEKLDGVTPVQLLSALDSLSAMPVHPYEQAKYQLFGANYKFPTIDDVKIPANFNYETYTKELSGKYNDLVSLSQIETSAIFVKPEKEFPMFNENAVKKSILNAELIKSITLHDINTKPLEVAQKIIAFYIQS